MTEVDYVPASIDFSQIPEGMEGKCVVVEVSTRRPMGYGDTIEEALVDAGVTKEDRAVVVARVPARRGIF